MKGDKKRFIREKELKGLEKIKGEKKLDERERKKEEIRRMQKERENK